MIVALPKRFFCDYLLTANPYSYQQNPTRISRLHPKCYKKIGSLSLRTKHGKNKRTIIPLVSRGQFLKITIVLKSSFYIQFFLSFKPFIIRFLLASFKALSNKLPQSFIRFKSICTLRA